MEHLEEFGHCKVKGGNSSVTKNQREKKILNKRNFKILIRKDIFKCKLSMRCVVTLEDSFCENYPQRAWEKRLFNSQTERVSAWLLGEEGRDRQGVWDGPVHTAVLKMDNQQGPPVQHRKLCPASRGRLAGGASGGEGVHVHVRLGRFTVHLTPSQPRSSATP